MPTTFRSIKDWQAERQRLKDCQIGFVPTMGNLHQGHASLITRAINENDRTVLSIFINPTQFNNADDLKNYPRTLAADLEYAARLNVDYILLPDYKTLYPDDFKYQVGEQKLSQLMEGKNRPGHFTGMLTVVLKLLNIIKPQRVYFGEKDYQQLQLVKNMVDAFFLDCKVIACPTIREASGLALSSRNNLLTDPQRQAATKLHTLLKQAKPVDKITQDLESQGFQVDYVTESQGRRFVAAKLGKVRLIDNIDLNDIKETSPC
ncbi:MAG: pantoate--beta-alanine ligase [Gammaproteobacteria bacterium]|nr:pantoate--beta-alanine ligase [Gammaproteobacteria bacterium]